MKFWDFKNLYGNQDWRKTWITREETVKKEGSEFFTWPVPATAPAGISQIEIAQYFPRARKYQPLDFVEVMNNDAVALTLFITGGIQLPVPASSARPVVGLKLWQIGIRNDDAAVTSTLNSIIVSLRREPETVDDWARRQR